MFEDKLDLQAGSNNGLKYQIRTLDYSSILGKVSGKNVDFTKLKISFDDTDIPVQTDGSFAVNKAKLGQSNLKVVSIDHKNILKQVSLQPGSNDLGEIKLELGDETVWRVSNFSSQSSISSAEIKVYQLSGANASGDLSKTSADLKTNDQGNFSFRMQKDQKYKVVVSASGFVGKTFDLNLENSQLELVPEGKIVYISDRDGKNAIYTSNYDGSGEVKIYSSKTQISILKQVTDAIYFTSNQDKVGTDFYSQDLYKVNYDGSKLTKLTTLNGSTHDSYNFDIQEEVDLKAKKLVYNSVSAHYNPQFSSKLWIKNFDGSNLQLIRDRNFGQDFKEPVISHNLSNRADKIAYVLKKYKMPENKIQQFSIMLVNTDGSNPKKIYFQEVDQENYNYQTLIGFTENSSTFLYQLNMGNTYEIYSYNLVTEQTKKLTTLIGGIDVNTSTFDTFSNRLYFVSNRDSQSSIYFLDLNNGEVNKVGGTETTSNYLRYFVEPKFGQIYFEKKRKNVCTKAR